MRRTPIAAQISLVAALLLLVGATPCAAPALAQQQWEKDLANVQSNWNPSLTGIATQRLEEELAAATASKDIAKQIAANTSLAELYADGDLNKAFAHATAAISLWKKIGAKPSEHHHGESFRIMGRYYHNHKKPHEARDAYQQYRAFLIATRGAPDKLANATWHVGEEDMACGEPAAAVPLFRSVIAGKAQYPDNTHLILRAQTNLAMAFWKINHESPACLNTADGKELVRLLREVAKYPAAAGTKEAQDVHEAQGYLQALHLSQ
jgi:hypothetical protein